MPKLHRQVALKTLEGLRQTNARKTILKKLVWLHNQSYHMISFFASHSGIHPKHDILNYHQFFIDNVQPTDNVLDVGCGNGAVAHDVAQHATRVVGIDVRPQNVSLAKSRYQRDNLEFILGDATSHDFTSKFDVIVLSNVLEHIEHRIQFLQDLSRVAPKILIRVPMLSRDWVTVYKKQQGLEYRLDDTHFIEYTPETFKKEIQEAGLHIASFRVNFGEIYAVVEKKA